MRADLEGCSRVEGPTSEEAGQAQLEVVAAIPVVAAVAAVILQLLAVGYTQSLADGAAEAGAIAIASDRSAEIAALAAVPGWATDRTEVRQRGGRVAVEVRPPALIPLLGRHLGVSSSAWARPPRGSGIG